MSNLAEDVPWIRKVAGPGRIAEFYVIPTRGASNMGNHQCGVNEPLVLEDDMKCKCCICGAVFEIEGKVSGADKET